MDVKMSEEMMLSIIIRHEISIEKPNEYWDSLIGLAKIKFRRGRRQQAFDMLNKAKQSPNIVIRLKALILLGIFYNNLNDHKNACFYFNSVLKLVESQTDLIEFSCQALIGLANARYEGFISLYNQALEIAQKIENYRLECQALLGLANADDENRVYRYKLVLEKARINQDKELECQAFIGLGNAREGGKFEQVGNYEEALRIAMRIEDNSLIAQALNGLGNVYSAYRENPTAIKYFQKVFSLNSCPKMEKDKALKGFWRACVHRHTSKAPDRLLGDFFPH